MASSLGFIPARGGSKGILKKNLQLLNGKPLIQYTIEAALQSELDQVIVSTDSQEIADVALKCGAEVPFLRPQELSGDSSTIEEALRHLLSKIKIPEIVVLLQPTSPLRGSSFINEALEKLKRENVDCVVSVSEPLEHPADMVSFHDRQARFLFKDEVRPGLTQRQEFPEYFFVNGAVYAFRTEAFLKTGTRFGESVAPLMMPAELSLDIDSMAHFQLAEAMMKLQQTQLSTQTLTETSRET